MKSKEASDLKSDIVESMVIDINVGINFMSDNKYRCRDDLIAWVRRHATKLKFPVVITNSDHGSDRRK